MRPVFQLTGHLTGAAADTPVKVYYHTPFHFASPFRSLLIFTFTAASIDPPIQDIDNGSRPAGSVPGEFPRENKGSGEIDLHVAIPGGIIGAVKGAMFKNRSAVYQDIHIPEIVCDTPEKISDLV